ncbi:hypothetical protein [Larkinella humicola]|uniref:hypothetical protein n=1 Tax=Larkinella humicola TaxID=2607654 RepID=UPI00177C2BF2|nr:hypothetical protein [Larkinella humicola]
MKVLPILTALLFIAIMINLYSGIADGFSTNRQALIAGGLTVPAVAVLFVLIVKAKQAE